jgi:hypothetical protein
VLVILPSPIPKLQHALLPPKCYKPRSGPRLLTLPLFSLQTHFESIKELKSALVKVATHDLSTIAMVILHHFHSQVSIWYKNNLFLNKKRLISLIKIATSHKESSKLGVKGKRFSINMKSKCFQAFININISTF